MRYVGGLERGARVSEVTLGLMRIDQMGVSEVVELVSKTLAPPHAALIALKRPNMASKTPLRGRFSAMSEALNRLAESNARAAYSWRWARGSSRP